MVKPFEEPCLLFYLPKDFLYNPSKTIDYHLVMMSTQMKFVKELCLYLIFSTHGEAFAFKHIYISFFLSFFFKKKKSHE